MKKSFLQFFLLSALCFACIEEIPLDLAVQDRQIVVSALITNDQVCKLYLTETIPIDETEFPEIYNARIGLFNETEGSLVDSFNYQGGFSYVGKAALSVFDTPLQLKIEVQGKVISAHSYIPKPVPLISADEIYPAGYDEYGDAMTEYRVKFHDPAEKENYYELFFFTYSYSEEINREISSFQSNEFLAYTDPIIRSEGLEGYGNKSLLFSDRLFNGETATIVVKYLPMSSGGEVGSLVDTTQVKEGATYALLRTVSKEYYDYRKAWVIHRYTQQRKPAALEKDPLLEDFNRYLFVGDPVEMGNSIENGVGIFAGYSQSLKEVDR